MDLHLDPSNQLGCPIIKSKITTQECLFAFLGCKCTPIASEIEKHLEEYTKYHLYLVGKYLSDWKVNGVNKSNNEAVKNLLYSEIHKINETLQRIKDKDKTQSTQLTEFHDKQKDISLINWSWRHLKCSTRKHHRNQPYLWRSFSHFTNTSSHFIWWQVHMEDTRYHQT